MKLNTLLCATAVAGAVVFSAGTSAIAKDWRGWNIHPEGYPNTVALEQFAREITEKTGGRVKATVFNGGILGSQPDAIEQTRNGALDFANFNMGPMGPIIPETNVLSLPFLFTGADQMHKVMDGEIGQRFSDAMSKKGLVSLSWFDSGSRSFYNTKKAIEKPEDVAGMKIRVMNNDLYVDMVDQLGGNATPMAYGEVYQSLKTSVIDGAENNYPSFESSNHYEVAKFYSITEHLIIPECICIAKASWDGLSEEDRTIVSAAAVSAAKTQRELWAVRSDQSRKKAEASGVKVNEVKDKSAFQSRMKPVYAKFVAANPSLEEWVTAIQSTK
jgi:tripartite ATP-independent transporter DctP family solute receptor